jgi:hypothetical protein
MHKTGILFFILLPFVLSSCSNRIAENTPAACLRGKIDITRAEQKIEGEWQWVETTYFSAYHGISYKTPLNTGKILTYTFRNDTMAISSGGQLVEKKRYEITPLSEITSFQKDSNLIIKVFDIDHNRRISLLHFCDDELIMENSYNSMGGNVKLQKKS